MHVDRLTLIMICMYVARRIVKIRFHAVAYTCLNSLFLSLIFLTACLSSDTVTLSSKMTEVRHMGIVLMLNYPICVHKQ